MQSYFQKIKQCIRNATSYSECDRMFKDVSQGSIIGPNLFNFSKFVQKCTIYIYADDNTISCKDCDIYPVAINLEIDSLNLINWFSVNLTKSYSDKLLNLKETKISSEEKC